MSAPVTHAELRSELVTLETRIDRKFDLWGGALLERMNSMFAAMEQRMDQRFAAMEQRFVTMEQRFVTMEQRWAIDLARHTTAIGEALARSVTAVDEKYADLPPRVTRLEQTVARRARKR